MPSLQLAVASTAGLATFQLAVMLLNKGNPWFVNVRAQKEPALIGLGVFVAIAELTTAGLAAGALLVVLGLVGRFSGRFDV
jgi:hypothetical protein